MVRKSKINNTSPNFKELFSEYADDEILRILNKRDHYQKEAAEAAIQEAIKRELIYSEQDLFDDKFSVNPLRISLFPTIEDEKNRRKIGKSIVRGLFLVGVIPLIFGFLTFNRGKEFEGVALIALGIVWMVATASLHRKATSPVIFLLFTLSGVSVIYLVKLFIQKGTPVFMDVVIIVAIYCFLIYGLLFLHRLLKH
ncbi:MAG: hypothetical protein J7L95_00800 [Prolixibacteraceae bacterium]|nr:hypothetical protein [Prolixibacteraceae bacterium]